MRRALVLALLVACGDGDRVAAEPKVIETWWCNPKSEKDNLIDTCSQDRTTCDRHAQLFAKTACAVVEHPYCFTGLNKDGSKMGDLCFLHLETCVLARQRWVDNEPKSVGTAGCFKK